MKLLSLYLITGCLCAAVAAGDNDGDEEIGMNTKAHLRRELPERHYLPYEGRADPEYYHNSRHYDGHYAQAAAPRNYRPDGFVESREFHPYASRDSNPHVAAGEGRLHPYYDAVDHRSWEDAFFDPRDNEIDEATKKKRRRRRRRRKKNEGCSCMPLSYQFEFTFGKSFVTKKRNGGYVNSGLTVVTWLNRDLFANEKVVRDQYK